MNNYRQFYNGPKGENYIISDIFSNSQELLNDLALEDNSPNTVGSLVMISYGNFPNTIEYSRNKEIDIAYGLGNLNSTIWKKEFLNKEDLNEEKTLPEFLGAENQWVYVFQTSIQGEAGEALKVKGNFNIDTNTSYNGNTENWWNNTPLEKIENNEPAINDNKLYDAFWKIYCKGTFPSTLAQNSVVIGNFYLYKNETPSEDNGWKADKIYLSVYYIRNAVLPQDEEINAETISHYFYLSKISGIYTPPEELTSIQGFYYNAQGEKIAIGQTANDNKITIKNKQILIGSNLDLSAAPEGAIAIGQYNKPATPETLFVIANGTDVLNKNNLFEIVQPQSNVQSYDIKLGDTVIHNQLIDLNSIVNLVTKIAQVPSVKHFLDTEYEDPNKQNWTLNYNGVWRPSNIQYNTYTITTLQIYCAFGDGYTKITNDSQETLIKIYPEDIRLLDLNTNTFYSPVFDPTETEPYYKFSSVPGGTRYKLHLQYSNGIIIDKEFEVPANNYDVYEEVGVMDQFYLQTEEIDGNEVKRNDWDFIIALMNSNFPKIHDNDVNQRIPGRRLTDLWRIGDYTKFLDTNACAVIVDISHDDIYELTQTEIDSKKYILPEAIDLISDAENKYSIPNPIFQDDFFKDKDGNPKTTTKATYTFMIAEPLFESDKVTIKYATAYYYMGGPDFSDKAWNNFGYYNVKAPIRTKLCLSSEVPDNFIKALKPVYKKAFGERNPSTTETVISAHKVFLLSPIEIFGKSYGEDKDSLNIGKEFQYKIFENENFILLGGKQEQTTYGSEGRDILRSPAQTEGYWMCLDRDKSTNKLGAIIKDEIDSDYTNNRGYRRPLFCL